MKFKFHPGIERSLRSPIEFLDNVRNYGFVQGGRTVGDAREFIIDNHAAKKGFIDLESIVIEELKK